MPVAFLFFVGLLPPLCRCGGTKDRIMHYPSGFPAFVRSIVVGVRKDSGTLWQEEGCTAGGGDKRSPQVPAGER